MGANKLEEYRGFNYEVAETLAPTWERRRSDIERISAPARAWMLKELAPGPGETILELAAGTGDTGFEAAALVGQNGRVIVSDFSPSMLGGARRRGEELGVNNVEYRVIDAEKIELEDDSVDGALCRFGYMLMADAAKALAETHRVLRSGGRLTLAVWGPPESNPFFSLIGMALMQRGHISPPEPPPAPGIFSMASAERTEVLLREAGFRDIQIEEVSVVFSVPDAGEYLSLVMDSAGPLAMALRQLPEAARSEIRQQLQESISSFEMEEGFEIPGLTLCAVGTA